jgi:hypothetical protein
MSEANGQAPAAPETVSKAEYEAAVERARRFEGQLTDKERTIAEYAKYGDPKTISALKADYDNIKKSAIKTPEEMDAFLQEKEGEISKRFTGKLSEYETKTSALEQELNKLKLVNPAMMEAAKVFRSTELELIQHKIEQDLILVEGQICVKGEDGKPKYSAADPRKLILKEWAQVKRQEAQPTQTVQTLKLSRQVLIPGRNRNRQTGLKQTLKRLKRL